MRTGGLCWFIATGLFAAPDDSRKPPAFSEVQLAASYCSAPLNRSLSPYWDEQGGFGLQMATPFYAGSAQLAFQRKKFSPGTAGRAGFTVYFWTLGWFFPVQLSSAMSLSPLINSGLAQMNFPQSISSSYRDDISESEVTMGFGMFLNMALHRNWVITIGAQRQTIFTRRRVHTVFLSLGAAYRFDMPGWLHEFFE